VHHRTVRTFQYANGLIAVERHHKDIAKGSRLSQVTNVAGMQQVEATVCEDDSLAFVAKAFALKHECLPVENPSHLNFATPATANAQTYWPYARTISGPSTCGPMSVLPTDALSLSMWKK